MFIERLIESIRSKETPCVVGLDPSIALMPSEFLEECGVQDTSSRSDLANALYRYCERILEAVSDLVPAVKPQSAYFERYGAPGIDSLERTIRLAHDLGLLVILDAKRGDIGPTAEAYAQAYLGGPGAGVSFVDCLTVNPYLGPDSLEPFVRACERTGKGLFVCAKTSNPGAVALQDLVVDGQTIAERVAALLRPWADASMSAIGYSGIGVVVGATYPATAVSLRRLLPRSFFLVPGLGAQGGPSASLTHYFNNDGLGAVIASSRAINYPERYGTSKVGGREGFRVETRSFIASVRGAIEQRG